MTPNIKASDVQKNAGDAANKAGEAGTGIIDKGREIIDGAVKKAQDALPNSNEEAGSKAGRTIDKGVQQTKDVVNDHTPTDDKNDGGGIMNAVQGKMDEARGQIHEWTKP